MRKYGKKRLTYPQRVTEWWKDFKMNLYFWLYRMYLGMMSFFGKSKPEEENFAY